MPRKHTILLGIAGSLSVLLMSVVVMQLPDVSLSARVSDARLQQQSSTPWQTITEQDVESGATVFANTNVFFQVPASIETIDRELLLGRHGRQVRYWGYCFPGEDDPENLPQDVGFPGKIFLSEAERAWRKSMEDRQNEISPFTPPSMRKKTAVESPIHHQLDVFRGGMTCYIMTQQQLAIAVDEDQDGLNNQVEKQYGTDQRNPDTDGDALEDWEETTYGTDPLRRDSDADGLLDGIEDANHNGRFDPGETDALKRDTDDDKLCDGLCHEYRNRKVCKDNAGRQCVDIPFGRMIGEDKNLNGKVDTGETDPRKQYSQNDGIRDDQRFYKCLLDNKKDC